MPEQETAGQQETLRGWIHGHVGRSQHDVEALEMGPHRRRGISEPAAGEGLGRELEPDDVRAAARIFGESTGTLTRVFSRLFSAEKRSSSASNSIIAASLPASRIAWGPIALASSACCNQWRMR